MNNKLRDKKLHHSAKLTKISMAYKTNLYIKIRKSFY